MNALTIITALCLTASQLLTASQANSEFSYTLDEGYPIGGKSFGNIAGVDVDNDGNVIIFHRGSHKWDASTFDATDNYLPSREAPIPEQTVVTIDPKEKRVIRAWGTNLFYMPHGLSLDLSGKYLWLTDVALHQVFKYPLNGSSELLALGTAFSPGNNENHFCKPTSVADTGDYIFVADGYCNSRVVWFTADGRYIGEFGQSDGAYISNTAFSQPTFYIPHKITYSKEAKMLCVADREHGRIQCFSFDPKKNKLASDSDNSLILNGTIEAKFTIADPAFNGRLFSLDYSPIRGGIIVAVSGESQHKPAIGFVYNVTTGQLLSRFSPPPGRTFGMAHDLAITGSEANSLYVVDISPVNLWKFSRPVPTHRSFPTVELTKLAGTGINRAFSIVREKERNFGLISYLLIFSILAALIFIISRIRRPSRHNSSHSFSSLYSNSYPTTINSLFGNSRFPRRAGGIGSRALLSIMFSRRAFFNIFDRNQQQQDDFSRIPLEESDNSDDDKSDSDVEEFNINQATPNLKINV